MDKKDYSKKFMYGLGAVIVIGFFTVIMALLFKTVPESNNNTLNIALGALITAFIAVVTFFYGSSQGSKEKTQILKDKKELT